MTNLEKAKKPSLTAALTELLLKRLEKIILTKIPTLNPASMLSLPRPNNSHLCQFDYFKPY